MASERAQKLLSKLVLRLDDGTLIKAAGGEGAEGSAPPAATVLKPADAYSQGSLTEAHLLKAQALLCEVHAKLPEEGPLRSLSLGSKRSTDTGFHAEFGATASAKRARSMGGPFANGTVDDLHLESPTSGAVPPAMAAPGLPQPAYHAPAPAAPLAVPQPVAPAYHAPPAAAVAPPPVQAGPTRAEWTAGCNRIIDNIVKNLGPVDSPIFYEPVDPKLVPDYYQVVKKPVCLKDIRQRLATGTYTGPEGFYADMDQLVYNCLLYNPMGSYVRSLGQKIEQRWQDNWRRNPLLNQFQVTRQPKPAAAKPAAKSRGGGAAAPRPQRSGGGAVPRRAPPKAQGAAGGRVPRTTSVNSYKNYQALPAEQQAALAEALQDENVLAAKMDGVVAILQRANQLPTNEEGEVELDLSVLSPGVVWELYEYVMGRAPAVAQAQPARSSFQLQEDSDYDPYGEEEED
ncbi:hypothetical protein ABPG77_000506 [Micractinium sp. CCAP 211/92]